MIIKYRLITTDTHQLDSYIVEGDFGETRKVYFNNS
jgi:hypothetical protein